MTEAGATGARPRPWLAGAGWGFALLLLGFGAVVFFGMGPKFGRPEWYEPTGWLASWLGRTELYPLADELRLALAAFGGGAAALTAAVFLTTRAATARLLAATTLIAVLCFLYYGVESPFVWRFFGWRWSVSMLLFALITAGALVSPLLAARWLGLPPAARWLSYLPIALLLLVYERNITGTDQTLLFALSPWPVVQIFGIELVGTGLGALVFGVGLGLLGLRRWRAGGAPALGALACAVAVALPALALWTASEQDLLPGKVGPMALVGVAVASALVFAAAAALGARTATAFSDRARAWTAGGLLVLAPIVLGQVWARLDYATTRDDRAQRVIDALALHYEREQVYPDALSELVEAGTLDAIPSPRIGFSLFGAQEFVYQNFGMSYLLEFSAPRWIQCAYNPPYPEEFDEEYEDPEVDGDADVSAGAWSCPSKPPELW